MVPVRPFLATLGLLLTLAPAVAQPELDPADYGQVRVEPAKTSIYVGSVSLRMPPFQRSGDSYRSTYVAKVRPYFFYGESGELEIDFTDEGLRRLAAGERVEFVGRARNEQNEPREITGHADPADAQSGRIKVRVRVSPKIELIFNTNYRFSE